MIRVFGANRLLALAKPFGGIRPIIMGHAFYQLVSGALWMQFHDAFNSHLSPYLFKMTIKKGCEVVAHGIKITLDALSGWCSR
jgi:hypothetical protein